MGRLVQVNFLRGQRVKDDGAADQMLARIGQLYQERLQAREALPGVLAALVRSGRTEAALRALTEWGEERAEPGEILRWCRGALAAPES